MENNEIISLDSIADLHKLLLQQQKMGIKNDFEIRIDQVAVIPRGNDLKLFFAFKKFLNVYSRQVDVLVYSGNSRRHTKKVFHTDYGEQMLTEQIDQEATNAYIETQSTIRNLQFDLDQQTKKRKKCKEKVKELETEITALKAKIEQYEMLGKISGMMPNATGTPDLTTSFGSLNQDQQTFIVDFFGNWSKIFNEEETQAMFGIVTTLGDNKNFIPETTAFLKTKINFDENTKG